MSIISYTGLNYNETIRNKLSIKEKRYMSSRLVIYTIGNTYNNNIIYNKKIEILFKLLNKKVKKINNHFRNYTIRKKNKLENCYKRLYVLKYCYNKNYLCNDLIYKIFNSIKIIQN